MNEPLYAANMRTAGQGGGCLGLVLIFVLVAVLLALPGLIVIFVAEVVQ